MSQTDRPRLAYSREPRPVFGVAAELTPGADASRGRGGRTAKTSRTIRIPVAASCPIGRIRAVELSGGWDVSLDPRSDCIE